LHPKELISFNVVSAVRSGRQIQNDA